MHRRPFDAQLLLKNSVPPYSEASLISAGRALGFKVRAQAVSAQGLAGLPLPVLAQRIETDGQAENPGLRLGLVAQCTDGAAPVVLHLANGRTPYQAARHLLEGAERRNRDTVLCHEIVLSASPSYYRPGRESLGSGVAGLRQAALAGSTGLDGAAP